MAQMRITRPRARVELDALGAAADVGGVGLAHEQVLQRLLARRRRDTTSLPPASASLELRRPPRPSGRARRGSSSAALPLEHHLGRQQARRDQLVQRPDAAHPAREDHRHAIAGHLHVGKDVRREEHRPPLALELEDEVADLLAPQRIEAGHRLVEHHQLGIAHQRLGDPHPLQHPLGELAQRPRARVPQARPARAARRARWRRSAPAGRTGAPPGPGTPRR